MKDEPPKSGGYAIVSQYATGEEWRNSSRKKEKTEPKRKQHPVEDMSGGESKVQC